MNTKDEALRLADSLERMSLSTKWDKQAAAELRRLHEVNQELLEALKAAETRMRCRDKTIEWEFGDCRTEDEMEADKAWSEEVYKARAAISKATGEEV